MSVVGTNLPGSGGQSGSLCPDASDVDLLRYGKGVVYLNSEIVHGAFDLGMPEKQLNGTKIAAAPVDQRGLRSTQ